MQNFWDERYGNVEYIYGEEPNVFFADEIDKLIPGDIIMPCDGEGRNGVYAATKCWMVHAFDSSEAGKVKALQLAEKKQVQVEYKVLDATQASYPANSADAIGFIYAHFPPDIRKMIHQKAIIWLKPGAKIILEAFNPNQLQNNSGGPKNLEMLYSEEMILEDFKGLHVELLQSLSIELSEGMYHNGMSDIIRFVGLKV